MLFLCRFIEHVHAYLSNSRLQVFIRCFYLSIDLPHREFVGRGAGPPVGLTLPERESGKLVYVV